MEMAHSTFWPECTCCWLLGYGVDESNKEHWAQKMTSWDPSCAKHPRPPQDFAQQGPVFGCGTGA